MKHGTAVGVSDDGFASGGQIRPGRKKSRTSGEGSPSFAKREQQRQRQAATGGISRDYDASGGMTFGKEPAVNGNRVIDRGGKLIFWRETVIRSQYSKTMEGEANSDGAMGLRRTREIAAAMQIQENRFCRGGSFDPFAGNSTNLRR
jgi:hypothetical protein